MQSIKISDQGKQMIMKLQSRLVLDANLKISFIEILDIIISNSLKDDELFEKIKATHKNQNIDENDYNWDEILEKPLNWEIEDSSAHIDEDIANS